MTRNRSRPSMLRFMARSCSGRKDGSLKEVFRCCSRSLDQEKAEGGVQNTISFQLNVLKTINSINTA